MDSRELSALEAGSRCSVDRVLKAVPVKRRAHRSSTHPPFQEADPPPPVQDQSYLAYLRLTPRPFLNLASGHFPPGTRTEPHSHPCVAIHGCLQGPLILSTSEGEHSLEAGIFYVIGPNVTHSWRNAGTQTAATISLLLDTEHPGRWPASTGVEACCRQVANMVHGLRRFNTAGDQELRQCFWLLADHLTAEHSREELILSGILLTLLGQIKERMSQEVTSTSTPSASTQDETALRIRRLLLAHVRDRLSVNQIAREVGTSPTRAKEKFRESFGCGIMSYFNQLKIWQAKRLLSDLSLTVEQISHQLGFSSSSYFSRAFLKQVGETPTGYRQRNAQPGK